MNSAAISDRERLGLRGPVKTVADDYSTTFFDRDGRILEWRGATFQGHAERIYTYDEKDRLIAIRSNNAADHNDEFRYESGPKTRIRHVPARPEQRNCASGVTVWLDVVSEGGSLADGGTVETTFNERDQPVESRVFDDEGTLLLQVEYAYDTDGRLSQERVVTIGFSFPKEFRDQIPVEQRAAVVAKIQAEFQQITQSAGQFGNAQRSYVYDRHGRLAERHMLMGSNREDLTFSYNERGDISELTSETRGSLPDGSAQEYLIHKRRRVYEYDNFGNWISRTESVEPSEYANTSKRQLTYYS